MEDYKHKEEFQALLEKKYLDGSIRGSNVITRARADEIRLFLQGKGTLEDRKFVHWVKVRQFKLIDYPALGLNKVLCTPIKDKVCK